MNIDPLAERHTDFTPYMYAANNPIIFIDPDGRDFTLTGEAAQSFVAGLQSQMKNSESTGSDNDCPSCRTKKDWNDYQQAENTAPMVGEKSAWDATNKRLTTGSDEDGHTLFYLDGELMDLRRSDSRAEAFGNLLGDAALIEAPAKLLKFVGKFFKSGATEGGFSSFNAFKKAKGAAGNGYAWHHIVEQGGENVSKFGAETIHNVNNIIKLEHGAGSIHAKVSGYYSSKQAFTGGNTVRQWLSTQSYKQQYNFGIKILKQFGYKP